MALQDLREYLSVLEANRDLIRVEQEVDPGWEVGVLGRELMDRQAPAARLEKVKGSAWPVVVNLFANRQRVASALGISENQLIAHWLRALEEPKPPCLVESGPCQEFVYTSGNLLDRIPHIHWNPQDCGPYITFGLTFCQDPDSGVRNMGIYRLQIKGKNRLGINSRPPQHAGVCQAKAEALGKSLPVAVAIGTDPSLYVASQAAPAFAWDEVALAGSLRGEPVPMVKCKTVDLEVPATAEIVLEGHWMANVREIEGPFGEFTGYYSWAAERGVIELTCLSHRRDPLYLATYEGRPPTNTHVLHAAAREPVWYGRIKREVCPTIKDLCVTYAGCAAMHVVVSIKQQHPGQARNVAISLLQTHSIKHVIVVDEDIDVRDPSAVEWAVATRVQGDRDVIILPGMVGMDLDPSQPKFPSGVGAKMAIDATIAVGAAERLVQFPKEQVEHVRNQWSAYGFEGNPSDGDTR
jgi:2,5-furandicarboxylate decarboxylase 1